MIQNFIDSFQKKWPWLNIIVSYIIVLLLIHLFNIFFFGVDILYSEEGYMAGIGMWLWGLIGGFITFQKTNKWLKTILVFFLFLFASSPIPALNFVLFALLLRWERGGKIKELFTVKKVFVALGLFFLAFVLSILNSFLIEVFVFDPDAGFYTSGAIVFTSLSIFLFSRSRRKSLYHAEQLRNEIYASLLKASLWGTVGFLITTISYWKAEEGGTYTILWGLMLIGAYDFIRMLSKYTKEIKPLLDKYSKEEQVYLENFHHILGRFLTQNKKEFIEYLESINIGSETAESIYASLIGNYGKETEKEYREKMSVGQAFEILGLSVTKKVKTIKSAYRKLAKIYHPDVKKSGTADKFVEINRAYEEALAYAKV